MLGFVALFLEGGGVLVRVWRCVFVPSVITLDNGCFFPVRLIIDEELSERDLTGPTTFKETLRSSENMR